MPSEPDLPSPLPPDPTPAPSLAPSPFLTRRRVLGGLGILAAAGAGAAAVPMAQMLPSVLRKLEAGKWADRFAKKSDARTFTLIDNGEYSDFLKSQNLQHLTIRKIIASHAKERNGVRNALPPAHLWLNLVPTLRVAELLSERLKEDVQVVISAYRTPDYNAMCPGSAKNSQHLLNNALDLVFASPPKKVAAAARELRAKGLFLGGVGLYPSFTHIDTRGQNSDW